MELSVGLITGLLFLAMILLLTTGLPIAFLLGSVGVVFTFFLWGTHAFSVFPHLIYGKVMESFPLMAVPLFILVGTTLQESGLADRLFTVMHQLAGRVAGGIAVAVMLVCSIFAALTGIGGSGTVTMGLVALPAMLSRNYDKKLAVGAVAAGGPLGILIPPSIIFIIYGMICQVSVARLFAGGLFPGLLLSSLFIMYILVLCKVKPEMGPPLPKEELLPWKERIFALKDVVAPVLLILAILGSIFLGVATPTEAAAIGAVGGLVCYFLYAGFNWQGLKRATFTTLKITAMVMWIIIGAYTFATVYIALGAPAFIQKITTGLPFGYWGVFIAIQAMFFLLGCLLDPGAIIMITAPFLLPLIQTLGYDPVWFGVVFSMNMQMGYLTPPFGYSIFYIKGIAPKGITIADIYKAVWPFLIFQAIAVVIVARFPQIALWLPNLIFGVSKLSR